MKKTIILSLVCLLAVVSCKKKNTVTISGEIQNYNNITLLIFDDKVSTSPDTIKVNNGSFSYQVQVDKPCIKYFILGNSRKELFVFPGQKMTIKFDANQLAGTYKYEGDGAFENTVLDSVVNAIMFLDLRFAFTQPAEIGSKFLDSAFTANKKHFERLVGSKQTVAAFTEYVNASIDYNAAAYKTLIGMQRYIKDTAYYNYMNNLTIENENYLGLPNYRMFLDYYIALHTNEAIQQLDSEKQQDPWFRLDERLKVIEGLKNEKIKEYLTFSTINQNLTILGTRNFDKYYDYFRKHNTDSAYSKEVAKTYTKKLLMAPGKPAPEFSCLDRDSNYVTLKDFRGKYVYVDFWATWCSPCMQEMPEYIKLQNDYKGKNIAFVSISLDLNKNSWKNVIAENKSGAINLFAPNGWEADVVKAYQIYGIPTFVLIDKDGNIIDAQAPRPSSVDIRKTLDELLK